MLYQSSDADSRAQVNWNVLDHLILDTSFIPVCITLQVNLNRKARTDNSFLKYSSTLYTHLLKV